MNLKPTLLLAVITLASVPAFAFHHHFHHHHHSSSSGSSEGVCLRWETVAADAGIDAGAADEELDGGEELPLDGGDELESDGGVAEDDAGTALEGTVRVCVERAPGFGCSVGGSLLPFAAALLVLARRR